MTPNRSTGEKSLPERRVFIIERKGECILLEVPKGSAAYFDQMHDTFWVKRSLDGTTFDAVYVNVLSVRLTSMREERICTDGRSIGSTARRIRETEEILEECKKESCITRQSGEED